MRNVTTRHILASIVAAAAIAGSVGLALAPAAARRAPLHLGGSERNLGAIHSVAQETRIAARAFAVLRSHTTRRHTTRRHTAHVSAFEPVTLSEGEFTVSVALVEGEVCLTASSVLGGTGSTCDHSQHAVEQGITLLSERRNETPRLTVLVPDGVTDVVVTGEGTPVVVPVNHNVAMASIKGFRAVGYVVPGGATVTWAPSPQVLNLAPSPSVTGIDPNKGSESGGTSVTITGTGFAPPVTVAFGSTPATNVTPVSESAIVAVSPAHECPETFLRHCAVDVTVSTPRGTSGTSASDQFEYTWLQK